MFKMKGFTPIVGFVLLYLQITSALSPRRLTPAGNSNGPVDGQNHPCYRPCDGRPMTCFYSFHIEWYQSMSKACYDCPSNSTDCDRPDCVVANGIDRQITVANRKMPGPSIEVCHNDKIIVNLTNDLLGAGAGIHWHGMHQRNTPFMDGVPFVTQCPIQSETTFTYEFLADPVGTQFWHSHIGLHRADGVTGALIVRKPLSEEKYSYDKDVHVIQIQDWTDIPAQNVYTQHYHYVGESKPTTLLVNGRGKFKVKVMNNGVSTGLRRWTKPTVFTVKRGEKHRFRLINAEFSYCPVEISIDNHEFTIIASDGNDVEPIVGKSLVSYAGERFDFIVEANQRVRNYWIKVKGLLDCEGDDGMEQLAILHYEGANDVEPPTPNWFPNRRDKTKINPENQGDDQANTTPITKLRALDPVTNDILKPVPDYKFYVAYDLYYKDNDHFNKAGSYGHRQVKTDFSVPTPQLNHISMKLPATPLLISKPSADNFCNATSVGERCKENYCQCYHILQVKLNSVVEVILVDEGKAADLNHPFHIHGHTFRVLGIGRLGESTTLDDIKKLDNDGKLIRNLNENPPIKDTVTVPDGGYTILRFKADNPGYWLFHCHVEFHAEVGMVLAFKVGEHEDMTPLPRDFPTCGDYKYDPNGGNGRASNPIPSSSGGGNRNSPTGTVLQSNFFAKVSKQYQAYHSVVDMPTGGQMDIVYKPSL